MKVLVTGGTGLVGSYVLRQLLLDSTIELVAIRRNHSSIQRIYDLQEKVRWIEADVLDIFALQEAFEGVDAVIHAAGMIDFRRNQQDLIYAVNVEGTSNIVNLCLANDVKKMVHISSVAAFGMERNRMINEKDHWVDKPINSHYSESKYIGEQEVWRGHAEGLNTIIISPSLILGVEVEGQTPALFQQILNGINYYPIGSTGVVDVRDVAKLISKALYSDAANGQKFICSAENYSLKKLCQQIAPQLGAISPSKPLIGMLNKVIRVLAGINDLVRFTDKLSSEELSIAQQNFSYDNAKSKSVLMMEYMSIEVSLREICLVIKNNQSNGNIAAVLPIN